MPRMTTVSYARGVTLNIGDFESVRIDLKAECVLAEDESFEDGYAFVKEAVDDAVRAEARGVREKVARASRGR